MGKQKANTDFSQAFAGDDDRSDEDWIIRLGFLIHDCARLRRVVLDEKFKPLNITRSQAWLMAYVSRSEGVPQSVLAEQMGLGKVALCGLVDRLEANELLERRPHPSDRRVKNIFITPKGRTVVRKIRKLTLEANNDILADIDVEQVKQAARTLGALRHNLQGIKDTLWP